MSKTPIRHIILIAALLSFYSCTGGETGETMDQADESTQIPGAERIDQSAGSNGANEFAADSESTVEIEIEFERGVIYGSADDVIVGTMGPFTVDRNGRVFITDRNQLTVHVFQADGKYLTSLGSQGRGPGEFMGVTPNTTTVIHSNRFYITDQADTHFYFPHRLHVFSLEDLSFSRTIDLLAANKTEFEDLEGYYPKRIYPRNDGTFLVSYHRFPDDYLDGESFVHYVVQDSSGTIISGSVFEQKEVTNLITEVTDTPIPYTAMNPFPFHGKSLLTVSGDNNLYAVNHSEEFKIDIYTPQGEYMRHIEHLFENVSFNRNEVLDYFEETNYMSRLGDGVALKMIREAETLPETWPALEDMLMDDENRLWISTIVEDFDIYEWWVLEETGELITRFEWPRDEPIEVVKNGYIYTREADEETGLQQVVRYRVKIEEVY